MSASNSIVVTQTIESVLRVVQKHVDQETARKIVHDLLDVQGNRSFRDTIRKMAERGRFVMTEDEKVSRLVGLTDVDEQEATAFVRLWEAMKEIDREETEERRVEHAREMTKPRSVKGRSDG